MISHPTHLHNNRVVPRVQSGPPRYALVQRWDLAEHLALTLCLLRLAVDPSPPKHSSSAHICPLLLPTFFCASSDGGGMPGTFVESTRADALEPAVRPAGSSRGLRLAADAD